MKRYCSHCGAKLIVKEIIPGGKAEGMSLEDIAKKHNVPIEELKKQIDIGEKIELEHGKSEPMAKEISRDHLFESPKYYTELQKMEKKLEEE